ncbi:hypothetical protein [Qipengyuania sp.]|uniref:hypothetical protein n=1 Tax=Qipengyuania sp. TaxID=2004515 RepID=UPI0037358522
MKQLEPFPDLVDPSFDGHSRMTPDAEIVVNGRRITIDGGALDAATVATLAGHCSDSVVISLRFGLARHFDPVDPIISDRETPMIFRTFPQGALFSLLVSDTRWDWGAPTISVGEVRDIAGLDRQNVLALGNLEQILADDVVIDLATLAVPVLNVRSRKSPGGEHGGGDAGRWHRPESARTAVARTDAPAKARDNRAD